MHIYYITVHTRTRNFIGIMLGLQSSKPCFLKGWSPFLKFTSYSVFGSVEHYILYLNLLKITLACGYVLNQFIKSF